MERWKRIKVFLKQGNRSYYNIVTLICPYCKVSTAVESNFCPHCGQRVYPSITEKEINS